MKKKTKITILNIDNKEIYKGNPINLPIKETYIINKSIEVFDDDEPCIIHQSHVINMMVNDFIKGLSKLNKTEFKGIEIKNYTDFLNIDNIDDCKIIIGDKR